MKVFQNGTHKEGNMAYEVQKRTDRDGTERYCIINPQRQEVSFKFYEEKYADVYCRFLNGTLKEVRL